MCTADAQITRIAASYRISPYVVGRIAKETSEVIWNVLNERGYLIPPNNKEAWLKIASQSETKWNFSHCIGAIDGKHIIIQAPLRSGSDIFNYKKSHSISLLAV